MNLTKEATFLVVIVLVLLAYLTGVVVMKDNDITSLEDMKTAALDQGYIIPELAWECPDGQLYELLTNVGSQDDIIHHECKVITERDSEGRPMKGVIAFEIQMDRRNGDITRFKCEDMYFDCSR